MGVIIIFTYIGAMILMFTFWSAFMAVHQLILTKDKRIECQYVGLEELIVVGRRRQRPFGLETAAQASLFITYPFLFLH